MEDMGLRKPRFPHQGPLEVSVSTQDPPLCAAQRASPQLGSPDATRELSVTSRQHPLKCVYTTPQFSCPALTTFPEAPHPLPAT